MPGPLRRLKRRRQPPIIDGLSFNVTAINVLSSGREQDRCPCRLSDLAVRVGCERVLFEVFWVVELGWVDEDADHHNWVRFSGSSDEGSMAFVQSAHRGDEAPSQARVAPKLFFQRQFAQTVDFFHQMFVLRPFCRFWTWVRGSKIRIFVEYSSIRTEFR